MRSRSYVKIEDGCNCVCSYCIINKARGPVRSKAPDLVLDEIRNLAARGSREIILTGIETAAYGLDFDERRPLGYALADLICDIAEIEGVERIGLGSLEPTVMNDYFVSRISQCNKVLPHFHLSLQSGCSKTLAAMKRRYNAEQAKNALSRIKSAMPEATYSADVIVGFPGETDEDYSETLKFCNDAQFLHLHIFPYSKRKGTLAAKMSGQISGDEKSRRLHILEKEAQDVRRSILNTEIARSPVRTVLFETFDGQNAFGHTDNFLEVCVPSNVSLRSQMLDVKLISTDGNICFGELI